MRLHRFYVSQPLGEEVVIDDVSLVKQWIHVFRYAPGDFAILFNGDGYDHLYSLVTTSKTSCSLIRTKQSPSYIPKQQLTLCLSLIKKDAFELAVQKATELGVTRIIPMISTRSQIQNISDSRLTKIAIEASEQCGRGDIPVLLPPTDISTILNDLTDSQLPLCINMGGTPLCDMTHVTSSKELLIFIGPEGGWSSDVLETMKSSGIESYSLGATVLRAETAAIVAVAVLSI